MLASTLGSRVVWFLHIWGLLYGDLILPLTWLSTVCTWSEINIVADSRSWNIVVQYPNDGHLYHNTSRSRRLLVKALKSSLSLLGYLHS
ncbi:hypothetical protein K449DRAFT_1845 [Hypoxylon sp. EC38]|nr:hypothetical protein K449DRAFT_1845 [Hypoxylon sp. EC38]